MGGTAALAGLTNDLTTRARLSNYFKQLFAQVTNPALDAKNEGDAFHMTTYLGDRGDVIDANPNPEDGKTRKFDLIAIDNPLLTTQESTELREEIDRRGWKTYLVDATFDPSDWKNIESRLERLYEEAAEVVRTGGGEGSSVQLYLSHSAMSEGRALIPSYLITSYFDKRLSEEGLRHKVNIHVEAYDIEDTHGLAMGVTCGADTVTTPLAEEIILNKYSSETEPNKSIEHLARYKKGMFLGFRDIMAKMGISTISGFRGGRVMAMEGLAREFTEKYFGRDISNPVSGATLLDLIYAVALNHRTAYASNSTALKQGSLVVYHPGNRENAQTPTYVRLLQAATDPNTGNFEKFLVYEKEIDTVREAKIIVPKKDGTGSEERTVRSPIFIRDLFGLAKPAEGTSIPLEEVMSAQDIVKGHLSIAHMSFGALSKRAINVLNKAGKLLGMNVGTGEGGLAEGLDADATEGQIAAGRFGARARFYVRYLRNQIKIAQGAKPGQGGQLPGKKVTKDIAKARNSTPGVPLVSPPPHHDIYSIEDLTQLIRDLARLVKKCEISVKLVASAGVGTVAAGVAKALGAAHKARVHISGHDGGTGASPETSKNQAGTAWEIGLPNSQQQLVENDLRSPKYDEKSPDLVGLSTDGSIRTGRDIFIAAILGADEVTLGTYFMIAGGCDLERNCHLNTCETGWATQDGSLVEHLDEDHAVKAVANGALFLAESVRRYLAMYGLKSLKEARGRTDILTELQKLEPDAYSPWVQNIDLSPLLHVAQRPGIHNEITASRVAATERKGNVVSIDQKATEENKEKLASAEPVTITTNVKNTDLDVGVEISGDLARKQIKDEPASQVTINTTGDAGQSYGAFSTLGMEFNHKGFVNDGAGKSSEGNHFYDVITPDNIENRVVRRLTLQAIHWVGVKLHLSNLAYTVNPQAHLGGNANHYGSMDGKAYFNGIVNSRPFIRNSGATIVVNGAGDNFCEYMTNGYAVNTGRVGTGAFTGMTGGVAFQYVPKGFLGFIAIPIDEKTKAPVNFNLNGRTATRLGERLPHDENYEEQLRSILYDAEYHGNKRAGEILKDWNREKKNFYVIVADEYAAVRAPLNTSPPPQALAA